MNRRPFRTRLAVAAVSAPLALGLVACGDDDSDDGNGVTSNPGTSQPSPPESSAPSETPLESSATTEGSAPAATSGGDALTAAATGLGAVDGGTVFGVDRDDTGGWEVSVVDAGGTEYDVRVSADGASVEGDPVEDTDDGDDASRDADERQRLLQVPVDYQAAVDAASSSGGTEVTGFELDEENGVATWEVQYDEDTATEVTVSVDAESGEVSGTEQDD